MNFTTPIEMPRGTHYGNEYYSVFSQKLGRNVHLFSKLEYFNLLDLEVNPNVVTFCEQPLQIEIVEDGKVKKAIFDMWVKYKDGREELQEVKYSKELSDESRAGIRSREQIRRQKLWAEENNIPFVVRTELELVNKEYALTNKSVIAGLVRRYTPSDGGYYEKLINRYLDDAEYDKRKKVTVGELLDKELLPISNEWAHLAYMYVNGLVDLNISKQPLDKNTEVKKYAKTDK